MSIILTFTKRKDTKRTRLFEEIDEGKGWSDQGVAVGTLTVKLQALEKIGYPTGTPDKLKVTIEPA